MSPRLSLVALLISSAVLGFCNAEDNILYTNEALYPGQSLTWGSHYKFTMQTDCNLVLYDSGKAVWSSQTNGQGSGCYVKMQSDGNLVIYNNRGNSVWASNTGQERQGNYVCVLQRDRNVVVYGPALWATGTNTMGTPGVIISTKSAKDAVAGQNTPKIAMVTN